MSQSQASPQQESSSAAPAGSGRRRRSLAWDAVSLGGVLALALLLRLWHLDALTGSYDEGVYWASLRAMHEGHRLFAPIFSSQPPFFLLSLYPLVAILGPTQLAARLGVVVLSLIGTLAIYLLARRQGGRWAGLAAAILLSLDHLYLSQSQTIEAEVPSIALMIVAVAAASYAKRYPWPAAALSGVATGLAIQEKIFAVAVFAPVAMLFLGHLCAFERALPGDGQPSPRRGAFASLVHLPRSRTFGRAGLLAGSYLLGLLAATLAMVLPYLGELRAAYQQAIALHLAARQSFAGTLDQNIPILLGTRPTYPLAALALIGFVIGLLRRRWHVLTAGAWTLAGLLILLRQTPLFSHHLILIVPGLALSAAIGLAPAPEMSAFGRRQRRPGPEGSPRSPRRGPRLKALSFWGKKTMLVWVPALVLVGMVWSDVRDVQDYPRGRVATAARLSHVAGDVAHFTAFSQQVVADDQYIVMLANRDVPPELVDTSTVRITTGYLTTAQMEAIADRTQVGAILFYTGRFDTLAGFRGWVERHFRLVRVYGKSQDLYVRGSP